MTVSALESDKAVLTRCEECERECFVVEEPACCPYCGAESVASGHGVVVRPH